MYLNEHTVKYYKSTNTWRGQVWDAEWTNRHKLTIKVLDRLPWYLGSFDTDYIIFRNIKIFIKNKEQNFVKETVGFSGIFYLLKWNFQNKLIIQQTYVKVAKVLQYIIFLTTIYDIILKWQPYTSTSDQNIYWTWIFL